MTNEQAKAIVEAYCNASQKQIEIFEKTFPSQKSSARSDKEAFEIAIKALEKQIPKNPIKYDDCEQFFIECPCCQKRFDSRLGYKGCPYCLQAIRLE